MLGIETLPAPFQAGATVGLVFVEAIFLYVSYGMLAGMASPTILDALRGE